MKLSVSIPDDLWDRAREIRPDLNPSHLVQEALASWAEPRRTPGFSIEPPEGTETAFLQVRQRLASQAREEFVAGYRAALTAAQELPWWWLQSLASESFDIQAWAQHQGTAALNASLGTIPKDWGPEPNAFAALIRGLGSLVGSPFGDDHFAPSLPYIRGFAHAMRRLWDEVVEGHTGDVNNRSAAQQDNAPSTPGLSSVSEIEGSISTTEGTPHKQSS